MTRRIEVAPGTYDVYDTVAQTTTQVTVLPVNPGTIAEASPVAGDPLSVTGSTPDDALCSYNWQVDGVDLEPPVTTPTLPSAPEGDVSRGMARGGAPMAYTPAVTVSAPPSLTYNALYADDFTSHGTDADWSTLPDIGYILDDGISFGIRSGFDDLQTNRSDTYTQSVIGYTGTIAGDQKVVAHVKNTPGWGRFGLVLRASPAATNWNGYIFLVDMSNRQCGIYQSDDGEWRDFYTLLGSTFTIPSLFAGQVFEFEVQVDGNGDHVLTARVQQTDGDPTLTEYTRNLGATPTYTSGAPGLRHQDDNSAPLRYSYVEFGEYA